MRGAKAERDAPLMEKFGGFVAVVVVVAAVVSMGPNEHTSTSSTSAQSPLGSKQDIVLKSTPLVSVDHPTPHPTILYGQ
jgi:hypothetical protein